MEAQHEPNPPETKQIGAAAKTNNSGINLQGGARFREEEARPGQNHHLLPDATIVRATLSPTPKKKLVLLGTNQIDKQRSTAVHKREIPRHRDKHEGEEKPTSQIHQRQSTEEGEDDEGGRAGHYLSSQINNASRKGVGVAVLERKQDRSGGREQQRFLFLARGTARNGGADRRASAKAQNPEARVSVSAQLP